MRPYYDKKVDRKSTIECTFQHRRILPRIKIPNDLHHTAAVLGHFAIGIALFDIVRRAARTEFSSRCETLFDD